MKKNLSIQTILTFVIAIVSFIVTMITAAILFNIATNFLEKQARDETADLVNQVNLSLNYYIKDIHDLGSYVFDNLKTYNIEEDELIEQGFEFLADSRSDINTIALFDIDGNLLLTNKEKTPKQDSVYLQEWFARARFSEGNHYFTGPHVQRIFDNYYPWIISYSRNVKYRNKNNKILDGVLLIDFNLTELEVITNNAKIGDEGYSFIIDTDYNIVYHPKQELINSNLFTENLSSLKQLIVGKIYNTKDNKLTAINTIDNSRFRLVTIAYLDNVKEEKKTISIFIVIVLVVILIFATIIAILVARYISKPLSYLSKQMNLVERGKFDLLLEEKGSTETVMLAREFNNMINKIDLLMKTSVKQEKTKRKLELEALQAKINPHFLYNTLDSVVWMAEQGDTQGVIKIISSLAKLFRISISKGHDIITIKEELEHVKNYLTIQAMRYDDSFDFEIILPENIEHIPTIKLIIQPIVENSIYHGIKYLQDKGHIKIEVKEIEFDGVPAIKYTIEDNGVGMDEETLKELQNGIKKAQRGIGVINVQQRIKLYYDGPNYGLNINSELDEGTTIEVIIRKDNPIQFIRGNV